jgi:hypothetical protein
MMGAGFSVEASLNHYPSSKALQSKENASPHFLVKK